MSTNKEHQFLYEWRLSIAKFVTVSLANGKSEAWVQDRTGHKSSTMIAKYRRAARMAAKVGMGPFVRMDVAVGLAGYTGEAEGVAVLQRNVSIRMRQRLRKFYEGNAFTAAARVSRRGVLAAA